MATKTLSFIADRYFFRSHSNEPKDRSKISWKISPNSSKKRYQFSSKTLQINPNVYNFSNTSPDKRSHSSETSRYYFSRNLPQSVEPRTVTFLEGSSMNLSDTPYLFSPSTTTRTYRGRSKPVKMIERDGGDTSLRTRSISPAYPRSTRMDTVTSTNGLLSLIKRLPTDKPPTVHFEPSVISSTTRMYLKEVRERLSGRRTDQSFERSVDRLVSSVNKNYGQTSSKSSSSSNYITQYYAREDQLPASDDDQEKFSYRLNINRTHTQIMKTVNRSLIDRTYHSDGNRLKQFEQNVHRYLRLLDGQNLQRELNYDLIRCFSSSYLNDLRQEEFRRRQIRSQSHAYTYEDVQDIQNPSVLEAYRMRSRRDRERYQRAQLSVSIGPYSPMSSSGYSPVSLTGHVDTHSSMLDTDGRSTTTHSSPSRRPPHVDVFYEIMQESFRGVDASMAGHISKASQWPRSHQSTAADIRPLWSDDELTDTSMNRSRSRRSAPQQRKLSRYLSTVNRSLLDRPGDLITDFYLSQLNRNMQDSVRHIETIARDKADEQEFRPHRTNQLVRSLSADHLYQVRREHLRYKQPFHTPTSFTMEDVQDIYKPFVLDNYKRKIAIELERRRRAREERSEGDWGYRREQTLPPQPRTRRDFPMVSPPVIVQTKEIIMGRARRTVNRDGTHDHLHHVRGVPPPPIHCTDHQPTVSQTTAHLIPTTTSPRTKLYTNIPQVNTIRVHHANRVVSESDSLSMVNIEPIRSFNQHEIHTITEPVSDGRLSRYTDHQPPHQQTTLVISIDEHMPIMHEDIPITEILPPTRHSIFPPSQTAHEISADSGISLNVSQPLEPPTIYHSPQIHQPEPLPERQDTIIRHEFPLALLFEEMSSAKQIIDDSTYWRTGERVEENLRIATIVYNPELIDENVEEFSFNIQNAHYHHSEPIPYEYVQINRPFSFTFQPIIEDDEQVTSLPHDFHFNPYQSQQIPLIHLPNLENPIHSNRLLTFNYPVEHSETSSYLEMETFLNNFEESIDHEQHLPFINQISLSYATSLNERNPSNYRRALPREWYQPSVFLPDEQLVEQWTVENHLATIQHEGTLHRHQVDIPSHTECENAAYLASNTDAFCINEQFDDEFEQGNHSTHEMISHCSPTSDYETDSVDKDNETVIIPLTILPSSSITNLTLVSQSSPLLTSHTTAPIAPIVHFLDVLALEQKQINTSTKDFLLTLGFGQSPMNEFITTVTTTDQPRRPIWINRSLSDNLESLPSSIHQEYLPIEQPIHFATEHHLEDEDFASLIHPHRFQFGQDLEEQIQPPLIPLFVSSHLHLPVIDEVHHYEISTEFSDPLPQILPTKIHEDDLLSPNVCQQTQPTIIAYAQIDYILDYPEQTEAISLKFDQPSYIDHYHIQPLYPFPNTTYTQLDYSNLILTKSNQNNEVCHACSSLH